MPRSGYKPNDSESSDCPPGRALGLLASVPPFQALLEPAVDGGREERETQLALHRLGKAMAGAWLGMGVTLHWPGCRGLLQWGTLRTESMQVAQKVRHNRHGNRHSAFFWGNERCPSWRRMGGVGQWTLAQLTLAIQGQLTPRRWDRHRELRALLLVS